MKPEKELKEAPFTSAAYENAVSLPQPRSPLHTPCVHQGAAFCYLNMLHEEQGGFQVLSRKAIFKAALNLL